MTQRSPLFIVFVLAALAAFPAAAANSCTSPNNTAPVAVNDFVDWPSGPLVIPVLNNDYDPNGQAIRITAVSSPGAAGQVQIAADQKSITFTPAPGSTSAQFSYSIADASGESCSTPGWVYVRAPGPDGHFTWDCNGMDCSFRAVLSTMEWIQNFTWRFTCPLGTETTCSDIVKTKWPAGVLMSLPQAGTWKVKMEAYYYTGKVVHYEASVPISAAQQFLKFQRVDETSGLYVDLIMTETSHDDPITTQYEIHWGDPANTVTGFSHISGIVGARIQHAYANPGLYRVWSYMKKSTGEDGIWVTDLEVVNAPPVVKFELTPDPANPNLIRKDILGTYDDADPFHNTIIPTWHWDMGDGWSRTYTSPNTEPYTYTKPGTFLVTLKLTDKHGASALATREITIPNKPPTGKFRVECTDLKCTFVAFDLVDELGVKSYTWNVAGQSITTTTPSYTHTFATAGRYPVSVTLSDGEKTALLNRVVEVRATTPNEKLALYMIAPCRGYDAGTDLLGGGVTRAISLATCIPADAVAAEVNAVVVNSASAGYLTLWSPAETQPVSSYLNYPAGVTRSNNGAVRVSNRTINARLSMATAGTSARIIVDVVGYYAPERTPNTGEVGPLEWSWDRLPKRLYDSRNPGSAKMASGTLAYTSLGDGYVPRAAFANVGIINSTAPGHLNVWATGTSEPVTSVINFEPGVNLANGSLIKVAAGATSANNATIRYVAAAGATADYTIDLYAQYQNAAPDGARYEAITPCRLLDTRDAAYGEPRLKAGETRAIYAPGNCGIPADLWWGGALRLNFTVVAPAVAGHLKTVPEYSTPETLLTSRLNFTPGTAIANSSVVAINPSRHFQLQSSADTDLIIDVVGYYRTAPNFSVFDYGLTQSFKMSYNWGADMRSQWDYGDGTVGMVDPSRTRCRTYEFPGTYNVKLIAWNVNDPSTKTVYERSVLVANKTPVALIDASQDRKYVFSVAEASLDEPSPGESVPPVGYGCSNVATYTALNYTWDYGDGTFGSGIESEHTYGKPGTYTMTLTATDRFGAKGTSQATFVIPNDPPAASFVFNCNGLDCEFDGTGSTDDDTVQSYQWTFIAGSTVTATTLPKTTFHFPATGQYTVSLVTSDGSLSSVAAKRIVNVTSTSPSEKLAFFPIAPCRTYDSRSTAVLPGNAVTTIPVTATAGITKCGVPATARAAALNLTVLQPTSAGYLTVWNGSGTAPVTAAMVFPAANSIRATQANVELTAGGTFAVKPVLAGTTSSTHLIVDVYGYFATDTAPVSVARGPYKYNGISPCRVYDSRPNASLSKGDLRYVKVDRAACGIPDGESALATNLHIINSTAGGHASLFSSALGLPAEASTINFANGDTLTNGAIAELGGRPEDDFGLKYVTAVASTTHVALDAVGAFAAANSLSYQAVTPCRALDTRVADFGVGRLLAGITTPVQIQGNCGVPRGAKAVAVHATVVSPEGDGYLRLDRPDRTLTTHASLLFKATDVSISNALIVELSEQQRDLGITPSIAGSGTGLHLVLDVVGFFKE